MARPSTSTSTTTLKAELQGKIEEQLSSNKKLKGLAALLGPRPSTSPISSAAYTFRLVAEHYGYRPDMQIPGPIVISQALKTLPDGRVCATREEEDVPCFLVFTSSEAGVWKLTSFEGDSSMLRLKLWIT